MTMKVIIQFIKNDYTLSIVHNKIELHFLSMQEHKDKCKYGLQYYYILRKRWIEISKQKIELHN